MSDIYDIYNQQQDDQSSMTPIEKANLVRLKQKYDAHEIEVDGKKALVPSLAAVQNLIKVNTELENKLNQAFNKIRRLEQTLANITKKLSEVETNLNNKVNLS